MVGRRHSRRVALQVNNKYLGCCTQWAASSLLLYGWVVLDQVGEGCEIRTRDGFSATVTLRLWVSEPIYEQQFGEMGLLANEGIC
jgi:hypothetical protein